MKMVGYRRLTKESSEALWARWREMTSAPFGPPRELRKPARTRHVVASRDGEAEVTRRTWFRASTHHPEPADVEV